MSAEKMRFWDRLWFLVVGIAILALGLIFAYGFWLARSIHPGLYVTEELDRAIDLVRVLALFPTLAVIGGGLWCFYQALKEE